VSRTKFETALVGTVLRMAAKAAAREAGSRKQDALKWAAWASHEAVERREVRAWNGRGQRA
jgi:hypothetical protein